MSNLNGNTNQFTKNQLTLIEKILGFLTKPKTVTFIDWNYDKIGPSGGGNIEGWLERELDYYLNNCGIRTRPKKWKQADLMIVDTMGNDIPELSIEIRTATAPSSSWLKNKIMSNQGVFDPGMYLYLYKLSKTGRVFNNITTFLKNQWFHHVWLDLNSKLRVLFATKPPWRKVVTSCAQVHAIVR